MFKRSAAILLTVLYLITATGFAIDMHYCGKVLTAVKFDAPAKGCNTGMAAKMKCCKDKQVVVKLKDAHQSQVNSVLAKVFGFEIAKFPVAELAFNLPLIPSSIAFDRGPPDPVLNDAPAFIKNRTFRI